MTKDSVASDRPEESTSTLARVMVWSGIGCCLQFFVFGVVGVVRGYSVQSWAPVWICLAGIALLIPYQARRKGASFLSSFCLIVFALVGIGQGGHQEEGEKLYDAGKYEEAIIELRREIDTWYLRLRFNYHEAASLFKIAECQSQLGQFEKARRTYREIEDKFRGYYQERAKAAGETMEAKLAEIGDLENRLAEEPDDRAGAQVHFDLALAYRELTCSAKAIEHYEAIQKLDAPEQFKESAKKFADQLR